MRENTGMGNNRRMGRQNLVQREVPSRSWKTGLEIQISSQKVVSSSNELSNVDTENYESSIVGIRAHTIGGII